ncbi:TlpA family protein disulfide reductase [Chryseobacterium sp. ISL-6]|nr:TlpA disulfide reductase family protein [Chryseobacterium sp. ISL-6]MBT2621930.1 TlpA family protein disulfide reductase [Chryseobacterium sp. ISL-6]
MLNYSSSSARFSEFGDKAVILDFWFIGCGSCRDAMPHLDSISKKYKDDVRVLLVTWEDKKNVEEFFRDNPIGRSVKFTQVVNDSTLKKLFPARGFPHQVWIDKTGVVRSINDGTHTNDINIDKFISGQPLHIPLKADELDGKVGFAEEPQISYYFESNKKNILNYSYFSKYRKEFIGGSGIEVDTVNQLVRFQCRNVDFLGLYDRAYASLLGNPDLHRPTRMIRLDGGKLNIHGDYTTFSDIYCYDLIYKGKDKVSGPWTFGQHMVIDLDNFFNVKSHLETRQIECYVIKDNGTSKNYINALPGESIKGFLVGEKLEKGKLFRVNRYLSESLKELLNTYSDKPIYIELALGKRISFEMVWNPDNLAEMNSNLEKFGLQINLQNKDRDVIVLEKKQ